MATKSTSSEKSTAKTTAKASAKPAEKKSVKTTSQTKTTAAKTAVKTAEKTAAASVKKAPAKATATETKATAATKVTAKAAATKTVEAKTTKTVAKTTSAAIKSTAKKETPKASAVYDENSIQHLEGLEHIRLRPGMYIGSLGDGANENDGIYILFKEGVDNSVDEFSQGFGNKIDIEIKDGRVKIRDYGRGIPLGKLEDCVSNVNTGAKYNNDVF